MTTSRDLAPDAPDDTLLPEGQQCGDCEHFGRMCDDIDADPGLVSCDYSPSLFRPRGLTVLR